MELAIIIILLILLVFSFYSQWKHRKKVQEMNSILEDILVGNLDRKLVVKENSELAKTYYVINEIVAKQKRELVNLKQSEKTYKQLVTSLSHDLRTPLASLMGYLGATQDGIVTGEEREEYIKLSYNKSIMLKDYIDSLFEWLKLESGERSFDFERVDICELSRELMSEWIPVLEQHQIKYGIEIPEQEIDLFMDESSYHRIVNNLMQNLMVHSMAHQMDFKINEFNEKVYITITDDGIGIDEKDLPHIFERLYKCDSARTGKGSGLGLAIVHDLVKANKGKIRVESKPGEGCSFSVEFSKSKQET